MEILSRPTTLFALLAISSGTALADDNSIENFPDTVPLNIEETLNGGFDLIGYSHFELSGDNPYDFPSETRTLLINPNGDYVLTEYTEGEELVSVFAGHSAIFTPENITPTITDGHAEEEICPNGYFSFWTRHQYDEDDLYSSNVIFQGIDTQSYTEPVNFYIMRTRTSIIDGENVIMALTENNGVCLAMLNLSSMQFFEPPIQRPIIKQKSNRPQL